ncbi:hypothetical protein GGX14DRAFT_637130 [Mycena pura]|uniref:Uncharacterized protein n=1 Tax=Mycena pura TaxID=153505 RepID=A0AAD6Y9G1_9AGAR|nr:hypothetical protein GGX14DRAFT_637130 [Mycena pura]
MRVVQYNYKTVALLADAWISAGTHTKEDFKNIPWSQGTCVQACARASIGWKCTTTPLSKHHEEQVAKMGSELPNKRDTQQWVVRTTRKLPRRLRNPYANCNERRWRCADMAVAGTTLETPGAARVEGNEGDSGCEHAAAEAHVARLGGGGSGGRGSGDASEGGGARSVERHGGASKETAPGNGGQHARSAVRGRETYRTGRCRWSYPQGRSAEERRRRSLRRVSWWCARGAVRALAGAQDVARRVSRIDGGQAGGAEAVVRVERK